jgi:hypothetical protein
MLPVRDFFPRRRGENGFLIIWILPLVTTPQGRSFSAARISV